MSDEDYDAQFCFPPKRQMNPQDTRLSSEERAALRQWMSDVGRMEQLEAVFEATDAFEAWLQTTTGKGTIRVMAEEEEADQFSKHLTKLFSALAPLRLKKDCPENR